MNFSCPSPEQFISAGVGNRGEPNHNFPRINIPTLATVDSLALRQMEQILKSTFSSLNYCLVREFFQWLKNIFLPTNTLSLALDGEIQQKTEHWYFCFWHVFMASTSSDHLFFWFIQHSQTQTHKAAKRINDGSLNDSYSVRFSLTEEVFQGNVHTNRLTH